MGVIVELGALLASCLGVLAVAPQLRRTARTGDLAGLSLTATACGTVSAAAWIAYSAEASLWIAVVGAVALTPTELALLVLLLQRSDRRAIPLLLGAAWCGLLTGAAIAGGWTALGLVLSIAYGVQLAPAVWSAWRSRTPSGIAASAWLAVLTEAALWGAYGLYHRDPPITAYAMVGLVASVAVIVRLAVAAPRIGHARALATADPLSGLWSLGLEIDRRETIAPPADPRHQSEPTARR